MKQHYYSGQFLSRMGLLLLVVVMAFAQPARAVRNLKIGDSLPGFSLPRADGIAGLYPSEQLVGQPAVIIFWRPNHELSLATLRDLEAIAQQVGVSRFRLLAVDARLSTVENVQTALANETFSFPVVLDPQRTLYERVGLIVCPTTLVFDAKGSLRFVVASHARQFRQVVQSQIRFLLGEIDEQTMNEQIKPTVHSIEPDLAAAWRMYNLGVRLQIEGKLDEAASIFAKTVADHPSLAEAHCALGFLKFAAGNQKSAAESFRMALEHKPSLPQAQLGSGIIMARSGEDQKAEQILLPLVEQSSVAARARYELGRIHEARGQHDKALKFFQDALSIVFPEPRAGESPPLRDTEKGS